jgi:type II secretory ATPase GspE/PulE/Tfp pilus assembly ATPase PilB-like protein
MSIDFEEVDPPESLEGAQLERFSPELAMALLVDHAVRIGASDLFLLSGERDVRVSVRQLGIVRQIARMSNEQGARCMFHVRAAAGLKYDERRKPQDGRWVRHRQGGPSIDLRLNTMPTLHGESMAMRILIRDSKLLSLESLGLAHPQLGMLMSWLQSPSGLVLVTGPTGAGKTTTLYACLQHLNDGRRKIHTIEDPIEYAVDGLLQSQVDDLNGPDYRQLLRAVLRQSPDVVMIGEVRDAMAAETAVRAANSGQLVFATLHAPVAVGAIQSLLGMGVHPHFLCSSLLGVIGQRLVRTLHPETKLRIDLNHAPQTLAEVQPWLEPGQGKFVYAAAEDAGADEGYQGRCGIYELLNMSPALADLISASRPSSEISRKAIEDGMLDFRRASLIKVAQGATSFDEILRVVPTADQWIGR